jgi:hypothetical protein
MFCHKKDNTAHDEIAGVIISEFVTNMSLDKDWDKGYQNKDSFLTKCKIYRIAIVLMVLLSEEKKYSKLKNLRIEFEKLVFGEQSDMSINLLNEVKSAMKDLSGLLFTDSPKQMTWARNWLLSAKIDETNPAKLALVAIEWMDFYIAFVKISREILK